MSEKLVVVVSCMSEKLVVVVSCMSEKLAVDIDPGEGLLHGVAWLEPDFVDGEKSRMVSV